MTSKKRFKLNNDKTILIAGLVCCLVLLSFVIYAFTLPTPTQKIFPMWIVEPNGTLPDSNMNITLGNPSELNLGIQNQMGQFEYCSILVKLRGLSSPVPISGNATVQSQPSPLQPIMNFSVSLNNNATWQTPFTFILPQDNSNTTNINSVNIDGQNYALPVPISNSDLQSSSHQFLFELWTKNITQTTYHFSGIWVSSPFLTVISNPNYNPSPTAEPTQTPNPTPIPTSSPEPTSPTPTSTPTPSPTPTASPTSVLDHFKITTPDGNSISDQTAGIQFSIMITAIDQYGNTLNSYTGTNSLTVSSGTISEANTGSFNNGVWTGQVTLTQADTDISIATAGAGKNGQSNTFTVVPSSATKLAVSGFPNPTTAGTAHTITVTAYDEYNNVATNYAGTVQITSSDSAAILPANKGLTNGVGSFSVTLNTAGSQSITATDTATSSIKGSQTAITVNSGALDRVTVTLSQSTIVAGDTSTATATGYDSNGNNLGTEPASWSIQSGAGGSWSANVYTSHTSGSWTVTASVGSIKGTATLTVNSATASGLDVSGFPTTATAGIAGGITVTAHDAYGNVATNYAGTVHLTSSDSQAVLPSDYTFQASDNGVHTFTNGVTLKTAGTQSITATDTSSTTITGSQINIIVNPGSATNFIVDNFPSSVTAGTPESVSVTAKDAYDNTATSYTGTVKITSSDNNAILPANAALTNGVGSFSVTLVTATSQSITATDTVNSAITGSETGILVNAATLSKFVFNPITNQTAGTAFNVIITAQDNYNNTVTSYDGNPTLTYSAGSINPLSTGSFTSGTKTISVTVTTAGTDVSITATDGSTTGTSNTFNVDPGELYTFYINPINSPQTANTPFTLTITAQDMYGNTVTGFTGTVSLSDTSGTITPTSSSSFTAGIWSSDVTISSTYNNDIISATYLSVSGQSNAFNITVI